MYWVYIWRFRVSLENPTGGDETAAPREWLGTIGEDEGNGEEMAAPREVERKEEEGEG